MILDTKGMLSTRLFAEVTPLIVKAVVGDAIAFPKPITIQKPSPSIDGLLGHHVIDLVGSGLTADTIREAGIYSVTDPKMIQNILNWGISTKRLGAAIAFPFVDLPTDTFSTFARLKPDRPLTNRKYEQPRGVGNRIYIPRDAVHPLRTPNATIGIIEGEKKALAATQSRLPSISVSGVWGWQKKREKDKKGKPIGERVLIDDLAGIDWLKRPVWIGFDYDEIRKPGVNHACAELARILHNHGALITIIELPPGPRKADGGPSKNAIDDYLVRNGDASLRRLIDEQVNPIIEPKSLQEWREELKLARIDSLRKREINLCRSPTGSGKTTADTAAMLCVSKSLIILPTHNLCREFEDTCGKVGIDAVAYPEMSEKTCDDYETAEKVMNHGLSPSQAICPSCNYRETCEYQSLLEIAEQSAHSICTHQRGAMSFEHLAEGREFISVHEDAAEFLRPGLQVTSGFEHVRAVADEVVAEIRRSHIGHDYNRSEEYFFHLMSEIAVELTELVRANETCQLVLPVSTTMPRGCDSRLWKAMSQLGTWPPGEALRLVKAIAAGEICELVVRVDQIKNHNDSKTKVHKSICAVRQTVLPITSPVWLADATADRADIESLIGGRSLVDRTPLGELEQLHPIFQIATDVKKGTSKNKVAGIIRGLLPKLQYKRIGVICHRLHVATVLVEGSGRIVRAEHFFGTASRGSNEWLEQCDCLVVLGTPRVPPGTIRDRLLKLGLVGAMARPEEETKWENDYWSATTLSGNRQTVRTPAYCDHDWHRAYRQIVQSELRQSIGRGRAVTEKGIPVIVVTTENLGLKLVECDADPLTDSQKKVLDVMKDLTAKGTFEGPEQKGANGTLSYRETNGTDLYKDLIEKCSVNSHAVAMEAGVTERYARKILGELARKTFVSRIGERGGWQLREPRTISSGSESQS
ncbi:DUF3854 domain-containing protein [Rubripirellula reticaptiva]|uniref:DUF3854 domain-containing protein n=1 Tax=Rubripirellula reticaptiva TaxID=2528013 RepID=A0A5C6FAU7_9BACT|nr:DUF3854 domain-containing protein [Rubripirellula reticaptiva]TWU57677.1 hypothetical protein Poly59_05840 [Rubripirellula reticaptiva]